MDEYCIKILNIICDYQNQNSIGIGISILDRKFYRLYDYGEVCLIDKINWLQNEKYLEKKRPYSISMKGKSFLNELEQDDIV